MGFDSRQNAVVGTMKNYIFQPKILSGRMTKYKGSVASIAPGLVFGVAMLASSGAFAACAPSTSITPGDINLGATSLCSSTLEEPNYNVGREQQIVPDPDNQPDGTMTVTSFSSVVATIDSSGVMGNPVGSQQWKLYDDSQLIIEAGASLIPLNYDPENPYATPSIVVTAPSPWDRASASPTLTIRSEAFLNSLSQSATVNYDATNVYALFTGNPPTATPVAVSFNNSPIYALMTGADIYSTASTVVLDGVSNTQDAPLTVHSMYPVVAPSAGLAGVARLSVENGSNIFLSTMYAHGSPQPGEPAFAGGALSGAAALLGDPSKSGLFIDGTSTVNTVPLKLINASVSSDNIWTYTESDHSGMSLVGNMSNQGTFNMSNGEFEFFELANQVPANTYYAVKIPIETAAAGNYTGGGKIVMDVALNDDSSAHDSLWIAGNVSGVTQVEVVNLGGTGAKTNVGIPLIYAGGEADPGSFVLAKSVIAGAYEYNELRYTEGANQLSEGKQTSAVQSWNLRSVKVEKPKPVDPVDPKPEPKPEPEVPVTPQYQPLVPVAEVLPFATRQNLSSFRERRAGRRYAPQQPETTVFCKDPAQNFRCAITPEQSDYYAGAKTPYALGGTGFWVQVDGAYEDIELRRSTTGADYKTNRGAVSMGLDASVYSGESDDVVLGVYGKYLKSRTDVNSDYGWGEIEADGYGVGATLTYVDKSGFYIDTQLQYARLNADLWGASPRFLSYANGIDIDAWNASVEVGKSFDWNHGLKLTPSLRLEYAHNEYDSFQDNWGTPVDVDDADFLTLEAGLLVDGEVSFLSNTRWYAGPTLSYELLGRPTVNFSGLVMEPEIDRFWGNFALGFDHAWNDGNASLYGDVKFGTGLQNIGDNFRATARLGVNVKW